MSESTQHRVIATTAIAQTKDRGYLFCRSMAKAAGEEEEDVREHRSALSDSYLSQRFVRQLIVFSAAAPPLHQRSRPPFSATDSDNHKVGFECLNAAPVLRASRPVI